MRGKDGETIWHAAYFGITPAYAGKSRLMISSMLRTWDHPRVCGEKRIPAIPPMLPMGSPPRMRGKVHDLTEVSTSAGITPAYAGKSSGFTICQLVKQDHPRVCGEKGDLVPIYLDEVGSPPRMRGKAFQVGNAGSIPGDHPRVCGEKSLQVVLPSGIGGSPPRMRGKARTRIG